jgi:DNA-binding NarL/FixJ family response regulator
VLTMYAGDEQLFAALEAGASAFVPKNAPSG